MQYLGGKSRTANQIGAYLNQLRKPGQVYWEPFVGAGWILKEIYGGEKYASDANEPLIKMWQALQDGWIPPDTVTEAEHAAAKNGEYSPELEAFIRFGCSFAGKWNSGYARGDGGNYAKIAKNSLLQKIKSMQDVRFFHADFFECSPPAYNCLIYCDPPYDGTADYEAVGKFDTGKFWSRARYLSEHGHTVVVSEYNAPNDFGIVWEHRTKTIMHTKNGKDPRIERLFRFGEHKKVNPTLFDYGMSLA